MEVSINSCSSRNEIYRTTKTEALQSKEKTSIFELHSGDNAIRLKLQHVRHLKKTMGLDGVSARVTIEFKNFREFKELTKDPQLLQQALGAMNAINFCNSQAQNDEAFETLRNIANNPNTSRTLKRAINKKLKTIRADLKKNEKKLDQSTLKTIQELRNVVNFSQLKKERTEGTDKEIVTKIENLDQKMVALGHIVRNPKTSPELKQAIIESGCAQLNPEPGLLEWSFREISSIDLSNLKIEDAETITRLQSIIDAPELLQFSRKQF